MTNVECCKSNVSELRMDGGKGKLKVDLSSLDVLQQNTFLRDFDLGETFECLNSSRDEEINTACRILNLLLKSMDPKVVLEKHLNYIKSAVYHPNICARNMALAELCRASCCSELIDRIIHNDILKGAIACLNGDIEMAKNASNLLVKVGENPEGSRTLLSGELLEALRNIQKEGEVTRFRVFEIVVLIATYSPETQESCIKSGILDELVAEMDVGDDFSQVNTLELLVKLASHSQGLQWLSQNNFFELLADRFIFSLDELLESPLLSGMLKLTSPFAQRNPKDFFNEYPIMVSVLFDSFSVSNVTLLITAMETVGCIARSVEGKYVLHNMADEMRMAIKTIAHGIENFPLIYKSRALRAMANIIELKTPDQETHTLEITKEFFHWLSNNPMVLVMAVFQNFFPKLRLAGLHLMKILAEQEWGQVLIKHHPGAIDFILDRDVESEKYCKNGKFAVVKTIVESPTGASVFDSDVFSRLRNSIPKRSIIRGGAIKSTA